MLFDKTKEDFAKDDLFEPNDTIKIKEASFEAIVEKLQIYNLSNTADDVKGIAFEKFLGKKVFLQLFVKVGGDWRNDQRKLREFGYDTE